MPELSSGIGLGFAWFRWHSLDPEAKRECSYIWHTWNPQKEPEAMWEVQSNPLFCCNIVVLCRAHLRDSRWLRYTDEYKP